LFSVGREIAGGLLHAGTNGFPDLVRELEFDGMSGFAPVHDPGLYAQR
jgi:hypothetical protein